MDSTTSIILRNAALARWWDELRLSPRACQPLRLTRFGLKTFSQNDEDGIILEIFNRIGMKSRRFVEIGAGDGLQCNTALLLAGGWSGLWLEASGDKIRNIRQLHAASIAAGNLAVTEAKAGVENINALISGWSKESQAGIDLLSIDIDGNDYWIWKAIEAVKPRLVVIEYNASYPPPLDFVVPCDPKRSWNQTNYFGASLSMLEKLGREKGFALVGCSLAGVNAFFVHESELTGPGGEARFHAPFTAREHYEPPRYDLSLLSPGHRPGFGPNAALHP